MDEIYLETLGPDIISEIADFDYLKEMLLSLSQKEYTVFVKCLNAYIEQYGYDNWRNGFNTILMELRSVDSEGKFQRK